MGCPKLDYYESGCEIIQLSAEHWQGERFLADDESGICGMNYGTVGTAGTDYVFEKNILGDIVAIYQASNGALVGSYSYDAWGNHITKTGAMADINPFRYRGYYWDNETGFYYLQSRYYDPAVGRFLNADNPLMLFTESLMPGGANLYQYCYNNPVMYTDPSGEGFFTALIIGAIIVGVAAGGTYGAVKGVQDGKTGWGLVGSIAGGAAIGGLAGLSFGLSPGGFLIGAGIGGGFGGLGAWVSGGNIVNGILDGALWGGIGGGLAGGFARIPFASGNLIGASGKAVGNVFQIAGQMGIGMGTYTAQTLVNGGQLTVAGYLWSGLGGAGAGAGALCHVRGAAPMLVALGIESEILMMQVLRKHLPGLPNWFLRAR